MFWRCAHTRKCPAGMTTVDYVLDAVRETHSHGPDEGRNAVSSSISSCFYHFAQSVWRKVQELGLQLMYNDPQDASLRSFVRKAVALAFVPCSFLRIAWDTIKLEAPDFEAVDRLTVYFEVNWI